MKYSHLILAGLLLVAPATFAENNNAADDLQQTQPGNITVKGKVVDENGESLPGAAVYVQGTTNGTVTDIDGNFSLSVPSDATVEVSFVGYNSLVVAVNGQSNLGTLALESEFNELEQIVVVGYGTQRKVDLTGAVAVVDAEEMKKVSNSNISTMLEGKVAGVSITTDGQPGADPTVRIRGIGSFNSTSPLYVIDGVPMGTTIRDFSPNDIESIQVLKDASAAAIYGSRAANGVIIITTKQGKKNTPMKVDYSGYVGFDWIEKDVYDVMNSAEYEWFINLCRTNSGLDLLSAYDSTSDDYIDPNEVDTDWFDEAFKTGVRHNHNINLSGGGENSTYNVGLDYYNSQGTLEGNGPSYERYTARINNTMDVKFIKFRTGVVFSHSFQENLNYTEDRQGFYGTQYPIMARVLTTPPTMKAYDDSTWCLDDIYSAAASYTYDAYGYGTYNSATMGESYAVNILLVNNIMKYNCTVDRVALTGSADVDLLDMIGLKNDNHKFHYNINLAYDKTYAKDFSFAPEMFQSTYLYTSSTYESLYEAYRNYGNMLIENTVTYDGRIGKNHINLVLGQTYQHETYHILSGTGSDLSEPFYLQISNAVSTTADTYESEHNIASYLGRLNYDYDEKYLLSATIRRDGSSRLSEDDRWGWFPSVSAGWRIDRESFFPVDDSLINLLKIRASYGELGNENIGEYQYMATMSRNNYTYSFGNTAVTGSAISDMVNTDIAWEKKKTTDVGLDLGMFNNQIEFTMDWYKAVSEDLLLDITIPYTSGSVDLAPTMNAASMENSGFEFTLAYHNHNHAIKFDLQANLTTLKNEVTDLGIMETPLYGSYTKTEIGDEVGRFYGYVYEGIYKTQEQLDNHATQTGAVLGDCAYADLDGDGTITTDYQTYLGSGLPSFTYGFSGQVYWNGFDFSISTFGSGKFYALDYVDYLLRGSYGLANKSTELLNCWTADNPNSNVPRVAYTSTGSTVDNDTFSQRFLQNAAFFKIANMELGYSLPLGWTKGYIENLRFYISAQNIATFSDYVGYNVDFAGATLSPGFNYCSYPTPRTFMIGCQLSF